MNPAELSHAAFITVFQAAGSLSLRIAERESSAAAAAAAAAPPPPPAPPAAAPGSN